MNKFLASRFVQILAKTLGFVILMFTCALSGCFLLLFVMPGWCENDILREVYSPDSKYKVVVFQRDCGATTDYSTQASLLRSSATLKNKAGNIFYVSGHPGHANVEVKWDTNRSVIITYDGKYDGEPKHRIIDFLTIIEIRYQQR